MRVQKINRPRYKAICIHVWYIERDEQYFIKIYVVYLVQWPYFSDNINSKQNIGWNTDYLVG